MENPVMTGSERPLPVQPTITYALMALNVGVFLIGGQAANHWGAVNGSAVFQESNYYRLLTAMFLHADVLHIAANMFALFFFGRVLEAYIHHVPFLLLYLLGGLIGSLTSALFNTPNVLSVGASGAVFAVLGGGLWYFWRQSATLGDVAQDAVSRCARALLVNLTNAINPNTNIDNWAHLGGLVGGVGVCALVCGVVTVRAEIGPAYRQHLLVMSRPRAFRILSVTAGLVVLGLGVTAIAALTPKPLTLENFSVTIAPGWRSFSNFQGDEFCQQGDVTCLAILASPSGWAYEVDRFSGIQVLLLSLEDFDNAVDAEVTRSGDRLQSRQRIKVGGREAIQRVYNADTEVHVYIFLKDGASILRIYASGSQKSFSASHRELETFLESLRFSGS